jgi:hypothetical protein
MRRNGKCRIYNEIIIIIIMLKKGGGGWLGVLPVP